MNIEDEPVDKLLVREAHTAHAQGRAMDINKVHAQRKAVKLGIRTKYQRARFAVLIAHELAKHKDTQVAAMACAIAAALSSPMEIVNSSVAVYADAAPQIMDAIERLAKEAK